MRRLIKEVRSLVGFKLIMILLVPYDFYVRLPFLWVVSGRVLDSGGQKLGFKSPLSSLHNFSDAESTGLSFSRVQSSPMILSTFFVWVLVRVSFRFFVWVSYEYVRLPYYFRFFLFTASFYFILLPLFGTLSSPPGFFSCVL